MASFQLVQPHSEREPTIGIRYCKKLLPRPSNVQFCSNRESFPPRMLLLLLLFILVTQVRQSLIKPTLN